MLGSISLNRAITLYRLDFLYQSENEVEKPLVNEVFEEKPRVKFEGTTAEMGNHQRPRGLERNRKRLPGARMEHNDTRVSMLIGRLLGRMDHRWSTKNQADRQ